MDISIVISLLNEKESLPELISQIEKALEPRKFSYEVIMVNDGSTDGSWETIKELAKTRPYIKGISFRRNYGKS
ncbi:MAG: glycosyltransferase, partial [Bacteroidales bacterium]|nr:glycosyltransferase [Bacteroidales bacterium]